jgi:hypothetical protein
MPTKQPDGTYIETIDDIDYCFKLWGAERSLNTGIQIGSILSGTLKAAGDAFKKDDDDISDSFHTKAVLMAQVIGSLFASMGDRRSDAIDVIRTLATENVSRISGEGKQRPVGKFDEAYRGKLSHLRKVVTAAAEVQYSDFFGDVEGLLTGIIPA